ncbi:MAG: hypothetical protein AAGC60_10825 [Acidobacteriota bacterium]
MGIQRSFVGVVAVSWLLAWAGTTAGEVLELPTARSLDGVGALQVALDGAEADVLIDASAPASLRAEVLERAADGAPRTGRLVLAPQAAGPWRLVRPVGAESVAVRVELVVPPHLALEIVGRDIALSAQSAVLPTADDASDGSSEPGTPRRRSRPAERGVQSGSTDTDTRGGLRVEVEASSLDLLGLRGARLETSESFVVCDRCAGATTLTANGGTAELTAHRGALDVLATDAAVSIRGLEGGLVVDLLGGSLDVLGGIGMARLDARDASLRVDRRRGPLHAELEASSLTVADLVNERTADLDPAAPRDAGRESSLRLIARDGSRLDLAGVQASILVQLDGADLEAVELDGRLELEAQNDASVQIADSSVQLRASQHSGTMELRSLRGAARLAARDLSLRLDEVQQLSLDGSGLDLSGGSVGRITRLDLAASVVDLDLSSLDPGHLGLRFGASSDVDLRLPVPCVVQMRSDETLESEQIDVTGCDLRMPEQPLRSARSNLRYGRRPLTTVITLDSGTEVRVRGQ